MTFKLSAILTTAVRSSRRTSKKGLSASKSEFETMLPEHSKSVADSHSRRHTTFIPDSPDSLLSDVCPPPGLCTTNSATNAITSSHHSQPAPFYDCQNLFKSGLNYTPSPSEGSICESTFPSMNFLSPLSSLEVHGLPPWPQSVSDDFNLESLIEMIEEGRPCSNSSTSRVIESPNKALTALKRSRREDLSALLEFSADSWLYDMDDSIITPSSSSSSSSLNITPSSFNLPATQSLKEMVSATGYASKHLRRGKCAIEAETC